jgi:hypothetical protein
VLVTGDPGDVMMLAPEDAGTLFSRSVAQADVSSTMAPGTALTSAIAAWLSPVLGRP